ncbi:ricin-type beta-trefoil lectin domain protein [Sorangium sp. So ce131]|uniref:ricin-type beta-trefoil lectin domain protein n=1 Tax=Sorangium sp. So ce131 TaxID=3133282 RepID=UPI003F64081D
MNHRFTSRVARRAILSAAASAALAGCGPIEPSSDTAADEAAIASSREALYLAATPWPGGWVPVCYRISDPVSSVERQRRIDYFARVRDAVDNSWQRVADIKFEDWGPCGSDTRGRLVVNLTATGGSFSELGYPGASHQRSMTLNTTDSRVEVVAMHEFGHALGFSHEFDRDDWTGQCMKCSSNNDCSSTDGKVCLSSGYCGVDRPGGIEVSPVADTDSIMAATYCGNLADTTRALSPWDVMGAQSVYGRKHGGSIVGLGGRCLNIANGTSEWGHDIIAWQCMNQPHDTWGHLWLPSGGHYLQTIIDGQQLALNVGGGAVSPTSSTPLISWGLVEGAANEMFSLEGMRLRAMGTLCVAATGTTAGSTLEVRRCGEAPPARERWTMVTGNRLQLTGTSLCLTTPSGTTLGLSPTLQACSGSASNQRFSFRGGGIHPTFTAGRCLNVSGGMPVPGSPIILWDGCEHGLDNEYFYLNGPISSLGQCVDILGGASFPGAQVGVYPCRGGANQEWDFHWP